MISKCLIGRTHFCQFSMIEMHVEILHFLVIMAVVVLRYIPASVERRLVTALNSGSMEDANEDGDEDYLDEDFDFDALIASSDSEDSDSSSEDDTADKSDPGNSSSGSDSDLEQEITGQEKCTGRPYTPCWLTTSSVRAVSPHHKNSRDSTAIKPWVQDLRG